MVKFSWITLPPLSILYKMVRTGILSQRFLLINDPLLLDSAERERERERERVCEALKSSPLWLALKQKGPDPL